MVRPKTAARAGHTVSMCSSVTTMSNPSRFLMAMLAHFSEMSFTCFACWYEPVPAKFAPVMLNPSAMRLSAKQWVLLARSAMSVITWPYGSGSMARMFSSLKQLVYESSLALLQPERSSIATSGVPSVPFFTCSCHSSLSGSKQQVTFPSSLFFAVLLILLLIRAIGSRTMVKVLKPFALKALTSPMSKSRSSTKVQPMSTRA